MNHLEVLKMNITIDNIKEKLKEVYDPELKEDLVSLNMIKDIKIEGSNAIVTVELTTPACPLKNTIKNDVVNAVLEIEEIKDVEVIFTAREKSKEKEIKLDNVKNIIAVGSGKGGVGKSTVATLLALSYAKKGYKIGLIDMDAYGPNVPNLLKNFDRPYANDNNKIVPVNTRGIKFISLGLLVNPEQPIAWRGPMLHSLTKQFLNDVLWGELDILFIDLPPGTGDIQLSLAQLVDVSGAIMVTTPQSLSVADTHKGIGLFRQMQVDIIGIIENMSYFEAPDTGKKYNLFGADGGKELADKLNLTLLGQLPLNADLSNPENEDALNYFDEIIESIEKLDKIKK